MALPIQAVLSDYDSSGKLLELQTPTHSNGTASAIFSTANVVKYKAFIWKENMKPISDPKECELK